MTVGSVQNSAPVQHATLAGGLILVMGFRDRSIPSPARPAAYVSTRILKGEEPADLPVQAPTKYELVINLTTAKALGVKFPATCSP